MVSTITFRRVGDYIHFLNFTTGEVMSFDADDGSCLLDNINNLPASNLQLDSEVVEFFSSNASQVNSRKFRHTLLELGTQFSFPTIVNVEINRRCMLACQHCYIPVTDLKSNTKTFFETYSPEETQQLLRSIADLGVFLIVFTGGEAFLNGNLHNLLLEANKQGFAIEVFSNLQFIPAWFKSLDPSQIRLGRVQTSIYSSVPAIHDKVTGHAGSFERTLANLKYLQQQGYYVEVATPLFSTNFDTRKETEAFFTQLEIPQSFSWPIVDEYYEGSGKKSALNITKEQFVLFCEEHPDFLYSVDFSKPEETICAAGRSLFSISANGDVFPCSQYPDRIGNLHQTSLRNIITSKEMTKIAGYRLGDVPDKTYPYNFCIGNNYSETGDPFRQPKSLTEVFDYYESLQRGGESNEADKACLEVQQRENAQGGLHKVC